MSSIVSRLEYVRTRIAAACEAAGRLVDDVSLVAVSKTHPPSAILEAYHAGQRHFGESYAQELNEKATALAHLPGLRWHFIGRVQRNKAKWIAPHAHRVHALEALRHAEALTRYHTAPVPCLVSVNLGGEASKGGLTARDAIPLCRDLHAHPGIDLRGLMTLPPPGTHTYFEELAELAAEGRSEGLPLHELSMGMSDDFQEAVQHGATWVRVGTAIFGPRQG